LQERDELALLVGVQLLEQRFGRLVGGGLDLLDRTATPCGEFEFVLSAVGGCSPASDKAVAFKFVGGLRHRAAFQSHLLPDDVLTRRALSVKE
jgi:hypothetical protein